MDLRVTGSGSGNSLSWLSFFLSCTLVCKSIVVRCLYLSLGGLLALRKLCLSLPLLLEEEEKAAQRQEE